ncbi:hypothetical protein FOZ62_012646, partial [Perkinsus olseni]
RCRRERQPGTGLLLQGLQARIEKASMTSPPTTSSSTRTKDGVLRQASPVSRLAPATVAALSMPCSCSCCAAGTSRRATMQQISPHLKRATHLRAEHHHRRAGRSYAVPRGVCSAERTANYHPCGSPNGATTRQRTLIWMSVM